MYFWTQHKYHDNIILFHKYSKKFKICWWIDKWRGADLLQSLIEWTKWCFETSSCYSSNDWKLGKHILTYSFVNHTNAEKNVCLWVKTRSTLTKFYFLTLLLLFLDTEQILWYLSFQSINPVTLIIMQQYNWRLIA